MSAPEIIKELVLKFRQNIAQYKSNAYNETETRVEFLNPFWEALGWDVCNRKGYALNYREVVHEDSIKLKSKLARVSQAPDYAFRIGNERKFFLEAKKPSVLIKSDCAPAWQLRRYGWSCGLALSVLSDFEEFAVYNCRIKPKPNDKADVARIKYLTYEEYVDRWDEIAEIFHRENILKGSFDRFVESKKSRSGTSEVDREFLAEIEEQRLILARDIARNNQELDVRTLNSAVQKTIDRILFLRMAEDKRIEPEDQLLKLTSKSGIYQELLEIFLRADDKYNSGFFHFNEEKEQSEIPDTITPKLHVSDAPLANLIKRLYPPQSPYCFDVLPVEIIGSVYERFLGKAIRLTPARLVKIEEKPDVKKAKGVFYTPTFIVDYIVKNTVEKLCQGKKAGEVAKLKILDPACGSGSFLLGAYQRLLDWHLKYDLDEMQRTGEIPKSPKSSNVKTKKNKVPEALVQSASGEWKLSLAEKKRILLDNIFGVDLDPQAVEVAKLSLSLRLLEGLTDEINNANWGFLFDRILPNLDRNIRCGNSLIANDFYRKSGNSLLEIDEQLEINAFDWNDDEQGFGVIIKSGGFDAVIGNPPYTGVVDERSIAYFAEKFQFQDYQKDLYLLFLEQYRYLLKKSGLLGVIVSNTWLQSLTYRSIRRYLRSEYSWRRILHLPEKVFDAVVDTHVLIFEKTPPGLQDVLYVDQYSKKENSLTQLNVLESRFLPNDGSPINVMANPEKQKLFTRITNAYPKLSEVLSVFNGVKPFEKGKGRPPQTEEIMKNKPYVKEGARPGEGWSPLLRGSLIQRYENLWKENYWIQYGSWLAAPRNPKIFEAPEKIVVRQTGDSLVSTIVPGGIIARDNLHIVYATNPTRENLRYFLALINSSLMNFCYQTLNPEKGEALAQVKKKHIESLPVRQIDFSLSSDVAKYQKIVSCVEKLLALHERLHTSNNEQEHSLLSRQISSLEHEIDATVYELYELTDDERLLVES